MVAVDKINTREARKEGYQEKDTLSVSDQIYHVNRSLKLTLGPMISMEYTKCIKQAAWTARTKVLKLP